MLTEVLYKRDSKGRLRTWQAEVEGDKWRTIAGLDDGKKTVSGWTVCVPASKDTAEDQAEFEANAALKHNKDREYRGSVEELDAAKSDDGDMMFEPMLAHDFKKMKPAHFVGRKLFSQPKLDGIRCVINTKGAFTRQGKPILSIPHVIDALAPFFEKFPTFTLDGELYNDDLRDDFQQITSLVRRENLSEEQYAATAALVQYHIYDCHQSDRPDNLFSQRYFWIARLLNELNIARGATKSIRLVPTGDPLGVQFSELAGLYETYMEQGYEGQIVRIDGPYENKRSRLLLKNKEFDDEEFPIIRVEEGLGNWAGCCKRVVLGVRTPSEPNTVLECGAGVRGTQDAMREVLAEAGEYSGGTATVRYFGRTNDGLPRFPVVTALFKGNRDL